jgi:hypothetical protein
MCADMTDKEAMMTVTLTIPTQLVQKHAENILLGNGISITNFNILPKTVYDCGDCDHIISLRKQLLWKQFSQFVQNIVSSRMRLSASLHKAVIFTQSEPLAHLSHWRETWLVTHSPYKGWRVGQRQGNGTTFHIQFCPLLLHVHVSRVSYTNIALFHVAAAIVQYLFKFVFVNGTKIA